MERAQVRQGAGMHRTSVAELTLETRGQAGWVSNLLRGSVVFEHLFPWGTRHKTHNKYTTTTRGPENLPPFQPACPRVSSVSSATDVRCMPAPCLTCALSIHQPPACFQHSCQKYWAQIFHLFWFLRLGLQGGVVPFRSVVPFPMFRCSVSSLGFVLHPMGSSDCTRVKFFG